MGTPSSSSSSSRQVPYDQVLPFDEASMSVDALVADSAADLSSPLTHDFDIISRSSTPAVPPGLSLPHGHPSPIAREEPIAKPSSRIVPTSAPFTPSRNTSSAYIPRAATPLSHVSAPKVPIQLTTSKSSDMSTLQAKEDMKSLATNSGLSKTILEQTAQRLLDPLLQDDFPILGKGSDKIPVGPRSMTPVPRKSTASFVGESAVATGSRATSKRPTPGILNIAAATINTHKASMLTDTSVKSVAPSAAFPPLPPSTPASAQSPAIRPPKTLRVTPGTAKAESPSFSTNAPPSASTATTPLGPTYQPSLASVSRIERPSTPVSEVISDNASITSASLSRPGSPPPTRIGSAPLRQTTKSQQKKQRREAMKDKEKTELDAVVDKPEPEAEIAPIMGRKKKQKKEKISSATGGSTPAASRPHSPSPKETPDPEKPAVEVIAEASKAEPVKVIEAEAMASKLTDTKGKGKAKSEAQVPPEPLVTVVETIEEPTEKPTPTPSSVLQDLVLAGLIPDPKELVVFKAPVGLNQRLDYSGDLQDLDNKLIITEEDRKELLAGNPVHKVAQGPNRIMLTPNGDCVRNLTPEEEDRYLELQSKILHDFGPASFIPARHNASNGFTLIGGRAVPNGPPAFFPLIDTAGKTIDPVSKIQRDEALSYINQYVLPSLSTNSQLERALNANALDADMLRPSDLQPIQNFTGYGAGDVASSAAQTRASADLHNAANGILATGLQSMTEHFATGRDNGHGQPLGNVTLLSLPDSESALLIAKKETEKLEKSFNQLLKKNRRLMLGPSH